ncbi:uncharacterized protein LOC126901136 [Daktulosphaira vitifoliae]|uniref:uncharacterized protein LOC126901136 n=1 Tax=Daktulosphaira vitifoliae TaxID=58002 RepID=UPI0021AAD866|nr:uncharacterized protein LOC126901136 [Daktulosphaira vitifoliae]
MIFLALLSTFLLFKATKSDIVELTFPEEIKSIADSSVIENNATTPCDRYLRSAEVEIRNPRNHKFITTNGWDRHRPHPELNVYPRDEDTTLPVTNTYYHNQQHYENVYNSRQQQQPPPIRTSKRIIYYATLPDIKRPNYSPQYPAELFYSPVDLRNLDTNRPNDELHSRLLPYENSFNRGPNSVTNSGTLLSRYDEPAEFRDAFLRSNEFSSKFTPWSESFNRISEWEKKPYHNRGPVWDKNSYNRNSVWDKQPYSRDSTWNKEPYNRDVSWDKGQFNEGAWEKQLVEVPLQKPQNIINDKNSDVTVIQSGVIDVRGDRHNTPSPKFTIVDVDPRPYYQQPLSARQEQQIGRSMHYEPLQPILPFVQYDAQPPNSQYSQPQRVLQMKPFTSNYENIKNNINTHQLMSSWTEQDTDIPKPNVTVSTHSISIDVSSLGNNTKNVINNTRITPFSNNTLL